MGVCVQYVWREGNECANQLARDAIHTNRDIQLLTQPWRAVQPVLVQDNFAWVTEE